MQLTAHGVTLEATVLLDFLTPEEEAADQHSQRWRFDIPVLSERLTGAVDWLIHEGLAHPSGPAPPSIGLFGANTGAAAALLTAADRPEAIGAVVRRGGGPELAAMALTRVRCPRLLIVGGADARCLPSTRRLPLPSRPPTAWGWSLVPAISLKNPAPCSV
ncbi:MAG: hypothetical protein ACKO45_05360 [Cyanobium sp.]